MNQSKKILAALAAVPVSVVIVDTALAAEATLNFEISNDFVSGKAVLIKEVKATDLTATLNNQIQAEMAKYSSQFTIEVEQVSAAEAQKAVEDVFSNMKAYLAEGNNTVLYGMFKDAKVKAIETGEGEAQKVTLEFTMSYFGTASTVANALSKVTGTMPADALGKVKHVHDYIVSNSFTTDSEHSPVELALKNTGSSHAYALYTYMRLTQTDGIGKDNIRYVYGLKNGVYRSWNIVKIGGQWYNLDVAANDNEDRNNKDVNYRYFLTNHLGEHRIIVGAEALTATTYDHLSTADNKAVSSRFIYFVDDDNNIKKIDKTNLEIVPDARLDALKVNGVDVKSAQGKMIYVKQENKESLYFVNTSMGHYLYELEINNEATTPTYNLKLLIKEPVEALEMIGTDAVKYTVASGVKTAYVEALEDGHKNAVKGVKDALNEMGELAKKIAYDNNTLKHPNAAITTKKATLETKRTELSKKNEEIEIVERELLNVLLTESERALLQTKRTALLAEAKVLEETIQALTVDIATLEKDTMDLEQLIIQARELYVALTPDQKAEIPANNVTTPAVQYGLAELQKLENLFFPASGTNTNVNKLISNINKLDIFNDNFYGSVFAASEVYKGLTTNEKKAVYNYKILEDALLETKKVDVLNDDFKTLVGTVKDPFEEIRNFITEVEKLALRYERLLPTLQKHVIDTKYIEFAKERRENVEAVRLKLNNTDETTEDYLAVIQEVLDAYNKMSESEKALFTTQETAKIREANTAADSVATYVESLTATLRNKSVATTPITEDFYHHVMTLAEQYTGLTLAQKLVLERDPATKAFVNEMHAFMEKFEEIHADPGLIAIEANVASMQTLTPPTLESFVRMVEGALNDVKAFEINYNLAPNAITAFYKNSGTTTILNQFSALIQPDIIDKVRTFEAAIQALNNTATMEQVRDLRAQYPNIDPLLQRYVTIEALEKQEARIVTDEIVKLKEKQLEQELVVADVEPVYELYKGISSDGQLLIAEADRQYLEQLYNDVKAKDAAVKEAIAKVQEMVNQLNESSSRVQLETLKAAYEALGETSQKAIIGYEKVAVIEALIEAREKTAKDAAEALAVTTLIGQLTSESTPEQIAAAREAYEALSEDAKKLVADNTVALLEHYESRMEELIEQAKKEAAVVIDRIERITNSYTEAQIKNIRIALTALSTLARSFVSDDIVQKLIAAENRIIYENTIIKEAKFEANAFDLYMNDINRNSTTAEIAKARAYYNRLSYEAKQHVTTYEKLIRLETMWQDPKYIELVHTYYPDYINAVKPGAISIERPTYDSLYIPDDLQSGVVAGGAPTWSPYEPMKYQNDRYATTITTTQIQTITDRNVRLKADKIEVVIPTADLKTSMASVGVALTTKNNQLYIQFTEGTREKTFSNYVEIHVPFSVLKGNASQMIERVATSGSAPASFKVEGSKFIIRTKSSGTFKATTATTYSDLPTGTQGTAIRELAKRGIKFNTNSRLAQSYKTVTKLDVALMVSAALDISSNQKSNYQDITNATHLKRVQGLLEAGIMSGVTSVRFQEDKAITKQEAAIIIANMYRYLNQDLSKAYNELTSNYTDIAGLTYEARQSIAILQLFGVISGGGSFEPTKELTRGEFAELFYKALGAINYL